MIVFFPLLIGTAFALTEQQVAKSVLTHFPLLEQAQLKFEAAKGNQTAAEGAFDHKVIFKSRNRIEDKYDSQYIESTIERQTPYGGASLMVGHRQGTGTYAPYDGKYATSGAGEIFAGLSLPVLRNFRTDEFRTNLALAKFDQQIAAAEIELKQNIYLHKALSVYYKWVVANQKVKIRESNLQIAAERQQMLAKRFEAGDIEKLKLVDNERSILKRKSELAEAQIDLQNFKTELSLYYRDQNGLPILPDDNTLPPPTLPQYPSPGFDRSSLPQLTIIEQELQKQNQERQLFDQMRMPGLNLELLGAKELSRNQPYDPSRLVVGLKFDYPLENRKAEGKTTASEYKYRALEKQRDYLVQELQRLYDFSESSVKTSFTRWEITNSEFEKTMKLADAERRRWSAGASDLYIVNLREQDAAEADIKRWSAWYEYHQFHIDSRLYQGKLKQDSEAGTI